MNVVLTGGKFNRVHQGHIWLLREAKKLGDRLIVIVANDTHNDKTYAKPAEERKNDIEALRIADEVAIGEPDDFFLVVEKYEPDVIVLGYDQNLPFSESRFEELGKDVKIVVFPRHGNYSTGKKG